MQDRAGELRAARVDHDGVPVPTGQDDPAARTEDPSRLRHRAFRFLEYVEDRLRAVASHASLGEGQFLRSRLPELALRPPLPGRRRGAPVENRGGSGLLELIEGGLDREYDDVTQCPDHRRRITGRIGPEVP
ncbi:hypothetical protein GCM10010348_64350 [Streptomyces anthocyanicus]|nr:hypothetical protein B0E38_00914 [Streptomyces sp. 111WW2]GHC29224.1 hypothetical protein GCM10010348_64350 [Streptomyces anthocyanicus]